MKETETARACRHCRIVHVLIAVEWGCRTPARGGGHGRGAVGGLGLVEVRLEVGEGHHHGRVCP